MRFLRDNNLAEGDLLATLYHALRTTRRQSVIQQLDDSDDHLFTTRELARKITSRETKTPVEKATGEPYRNVYNALSQTHLSTLSETGIIIYDPKRQTVQRGTNFDLAALLLNTNVSMANTISSLQERE